MLFSELRKKAVIQLIDLYQLQDEIKDIGSGIYLSYPDFFSKIIKGKEVDFEDANQTKFCLASFLMFKFLIQSDDLIDNSQLPDKKRILNAVNSYNLSLRLLTDLFPIQSNFWNNFKKRQEDYTEGLLFEQYTIDSNFKVETYNTPIDTSMYQEYFYKKCAISSLAIDGIYEMNKSTSNEQTYQLAHKINDLFNFAFCVLDDVEDFRKDIGKNQLNYAHHFYISKNNSTIDNLDNFLFDSIESFYTSGCAIEIVSYAKDKLKECLIELEKFSYSDDIKLLIEIKLTDINNKISILSEYIS